MRGQPGASATPKRGRRPDYKPADFPPPDAAVVAPTLDARRRVVGARRRAERQTWKRRADLRTLGSTLACNVGLVQRHLGDEACRRKRGSLQHALTLYAREARAVENVAQERMDAARDAAAGAKRENRLESRRDLEAKVADVRATIRGVADEKRRTGRKFALTPGIFSSLIAPDEESRRRRREANLLSEWRAAVQDERHRVETLRSTHLDHYADERLSPYVHYRGPKNREELGTASSLVDGSGVFKEAPPPPDAADPFRGIFKPLDDPAYESNLMDLSRNPFLRQPSNLEHLSDLRGMEHLGSWEVSDGIHNDDSVLVPGTSLPPSMMSADRIYRPKPRKEPIRL